MTPLPSAQTKAATQPPEKKSVPEKKPVTDQPITMSLEIPGKAELKALYQTQKANGIHPLRALYRSYTDDRAQVGNTAPNPAIVAADPIQLINLHGWNRPGVTEIVPNRGLVPLHGATANTMALAVRSVGRLTQGNKTELFVDGRTAYPALEKLIQGAKKTLYIETMIWHNDSSGQRIAADVIAAHKRGVDVKIMVDSIGLNFGTGRNNDPGLLDQMRKQGVHVEVFNPNFVTKDGVAITHHKIYIADNEKFLSGGINIGNEYEHEWHDMLFMVEGPAARNVAKEFAINWGRTTGEKVTIPEPTKVTPLPGNAAVGIAVTDPIGRRYEMRRVNLQMISEAKHHIQIQMPYVSDDDLMDSLKAAARRGVTVDFIMPQVNDTGTYGTMNPLEAKDLIKAGGNVHFYAGGTMDGKAVERFSHTKMMIIDETVAVVGSGNADYRTYHNNNELNAYIADPTFVNKLETQLFMKDWKESKPATVASLDARPLKDKLAGMFYRSLDHFF